MYAWMIGQKDFFVTIPSLIMILRSFVIIIFETTLFEDIQ